MAWVVQFNPASRGDALAECIGQAEMALRRRAGRVMRLIGRNSHTFAVADGKGQPEDIGEELQRILLGCRGVEKVERNRVAHVA